MNITIIILIMLSIANHNTMDCYSPTSISIIINEKTLPSLVLAKRSYLHTAVRREVIAVRRRYYTCGRREETSCVVMALARSTRYYFFFNKPDFEKIGSLSSTVRVCVFFFSVVCCVDVEDAL